MIKTFILAFIIGLSLFTGGCAQNSSSGSEEKSSERDAVNTLQFGTKYSVKGEVNDLRDLVAGLLGENYWPDTLFSGEELSERTGISEEMYDSFLAEYQHTGAGIDRMILIEAKEDQIENIENYLNEYRDVLLQIYEQQPQNKAKVFASRIETIDRYVCFVQLGADLSALKEKGEDEMIRHCQEENERALDIIEKNVLK
ncbi:putative uncharacterized protein [Firmicutes bacterium CAG:534]|nr:putative uncharacterized protein [Firmicutes bacterium CAG:534]